MGFINTTSNLGGGANAAQINKRQKAAAKANAAGIPATMDQRQNNTIIQQNQEIIALLREVRDLMRWSADQQHQRSMES